jgi:hypothetical protein
VSLEHSPARARRYVTRRQFVEHANAEGIPLTYSTLNKLMMRNRNEGPRDAVLGMFGNREILDLERALRWARDRIQPKSPNA